MAINVLSLDGGGVRGLSTLLILQRIMYILDGKIDASVPRPLLPCNYFDMIAGTSTGGLIAIMLGVLEMDVKTCIEEYLEMAPKIFPEEGFVARSKFGKLVKGVVGTARFDEKALEACVKEMAAKKFGERREDATLEDEATRGTPPNCHTFVCVTNKDVGKGFRLRNYRSSWEEGTGCFIWQAARATSAAPLYFPSIRFGTPPANYVDGGINYNNPIRALVDEVKLVWPEFNSETTCIISIGTGVPPQKPIGNTGKDIIESLIRIATDTQQTADDFADEMTHLSRNRNGALSYLRLNVDHGLENIKLEEWRDFDKLTGATNHYLNTHKAEIQRCVDGLLNQSVRFREDGFKLISELPISSGQFFGRVQEMTQINEHLRKEGSKRKGLVLWGLSGSGKSRLALEFVHRYKHEYSTILWINATSLESAALSYSDCAHALDLGQISANASLGTTADMHLVHRWLSFNNQKSWLLVIDSIDDLDSFDCRRLVPQCGHGSVIVTSTLLRTAECLEFPGVEISGLDDKAGCEMLLSRKEDKGTYQDEISAEEIVRALDGIPLAIEQARAATNRGIALNEFLKFYNTQYQELMAQKPERSAWSYEKNRPILSTFNMLLPQLNKDANTANLLAFASCFGPVITSLDLFKQNSGLENVKSVSETGSFHTLRDKVKWLKLMTSNHLALRSAVTNLEDLCLSKARRDADSKITSISIHNSISTWRLETLESTAREEWMILAAYAFSNQLQRKAIDVGFQLRYLPAAKRCQDMIHKYIKNESLEAPQGRFCDLYGVLAARFAQIYLGNGDLGNAETMLTAAIEYQMVIQDSSWPKDRVSCILLRDLAETFWKRAKSDLAEEAYESLVEACSEILPDGDDLTVSITTRLKDIRDRKKIDAENEMRAAIASQSEKQRPSGSHEARSVDDAGPSAIDDEEWRLTQTLELTREEFASTDNLTLKAVHDLAKYYTQRGEYSKAIPLWAERRQILTFTVVAPVLQGIHRVGKDELEGFDEEWHCIVKGDGSAQASEDSLQGLLVFAAYSGRCDLIEILVLSGADPNKFYSGLAPLFAAICSQDLASVAQLLAYGAKTETRDLRGATSLILAYRDLNMILMQMAELLLKYGADVNAQDVSLRTALDYGIQRGVDEETLEVLLKNGAKVRSFRWLSDHDFVPPLHGAMISCSHLSTVELLIGYGADVNAIDKDGMTPLDKLSEWEQSSDIREYLLIFGAKTGRELRESRATSLGSATFDEGQADSKKIFQGETDREDRTAPGMEGDAKGKGKEKAVD